nr:hypothetical protein [Tanacetum cinerariifolium]
MELCTNLQSRVLDLERIKTTQALEITSLKRKVKKLEKKQRSKTHKLKRLYKWRKIIDIDTDEDITLVNDQDDAEIFDVNDLHGEEVFVEKKVADKEVSAAGKVNAASIATTDDVQAKIDDDYQMAERLQVKEQQELTDAEKATLFMQLLEKRRKFFAAKRAKDKRNKPSTQAQQGKIMCTYLKNVEGKKLKDLKNKSSDSIQKIFNRAFKRVSTFVDFITQLVEGTLKRAGEELTQESDKKKKVEDDKETVELKHLMEIIPNEEQVAIDVISLVVQSPRIVDWKIYKKGKKCYYQILRANGKSQMYMFFR